MENYPIDFVITWVDGNDPDWQDSKAKYKGNQGDSRNSRYRDWDTLRFLMRSIEENAPWVHKVYLITCGHIPQWLNTENEKLVHVKHSDYLPKEFLPTFSSRTIDMNFHRIESLAEHFVYFNDDMILLNEVKKDDFFYKGLPCDTAVLRPANVVSNKKGIKESTSEMYLAPIIDMAMINKHFNKHHSILAHLDKWYSPKYGLEILKTLSLSIWNFFPGIREYHCCYSYLKETYRELWRIAEQELYSTCEHKFRTNTDYNHWVFSYWQIAKGSFAPRNPKFGAAFSMTDEENHNQQIMRIIRSKKYKMVCINDSVSDENYYNTKKLLVDELNKLFPNKCSFEK